MSEQQLYKYIPEWIEKRLEDGSLIERAGGVIAISSGNDEGKPIAYIKHLDDMQSAGNYRVYKEVFGALRCGEKQKIEQSEQSQRLRKGVEVAKGLMEITDGISALLSVSKEVNKSSFSVITKLIQSTSLFLWQRDGDQNALMTRETIDIAHGNMETLRTVKDLQYAGFVKSIGRATDLLQRHLESGESEQAHRAGLLFEEGLADIRTLFSLLDGEQMLGDILRVWKLFDSAAICAAGELQTLNITNARVGEKRAALTGHRKFWEGIIEKVESVPNPTERIPTGEMLKTEMLYGLNKIKQKWMKSATTLKELLQSEIVFLHVLGELPKAEYELAFEQSEKKGRTLCIVTNQIGIQ